MITGLKGNRDIQFWTDVESCDEAVASRKRETAPKKRWRIPNLHVKDVAEDSVFPFKGGDSVFVKIDFKVGETSKLQVEKKEIGRSIRLQTTEQREPRRPHFLF